MAPARRPAFFSWCPPWLAYVLAGAITLLVALVYDHVTGALGSKPMLILFLMPIILSSYLGGLGPGLLATFIAALVADYSILEPVQSFHIARTADVVRLVVLGVMGILISLMSGALHRAWWRAEESRRQMAVTLASISDAVITTNREGRVISLNQEAERLTGWTNAEAQGRALNTVFRIINETTRLPVEDPVEKVLRNGAVVGLANHTILLAQDGKETPIDDNAAPLRQGDGQIIGVVLVFRDGMEKKAAEKSLREKADQLDEVMTQTRCIMNAGEVTAPAGWRERALENDSPFTWNFPVQNEATAQKIFPLELAAGERYQQAWVRSRQLVDGAQMNHNSGRALLNDLPYYRNEFRCTDKNGQEHWMQQLVTVRKLAEGRWHITGITTDISELKKAVDALRESEMRFRSYVENAPLAVFIMGRDGRFVDCNRAAVELLGYDAATLKTMSAPDIHPPADREMVRQNLATLMDQRHIEGEYQLLRQDGKLIWVGMRAVMTSDGHFIGFFQDITERKQGEEMQRRLATAVEQAAEDIMITDAGGKILYVNPAFERITGYPREEVIGRNPRFLKSDQHDANFYREMWAAISRGEVWSGHIINKKKDGTFFEEEATISPIRDSNGKIINYVGVRRDVTREVALEAQLRQSQKMQAIGQLAGGIAHDFNNLLMVIRGNATMIELCNQAPQSAEIAECAQQILEASDRAANLTRQLLLFGRKQAIQPIRLDLNNAVAQMTKLLKRILGEDIALTSNYAASLPSIEADTGMIEQILLNLAVNSRDAMPHGGQLTVTTGTEMVGPETIGAKPGAAAGIYVRLTVSDTGCGIAQEHLPHIFEPFFTTKEIGKGTGLGLATVHGIVQQHNGWIALSSEVNRGTTFRIYFPVMEGEEVAAPALVEYSRPARGSETILVVEDERILRRTVTNMLERFGYTVVSAASGAEALTVWQNHQERIQLLLTDIVMPDGVTGYELARLLQAVKPDLKVIYTSGYSGDLADKRVPMREGENFLQKPYAPHKLAEALRKNLD